MGPSLHAFYEDLHRDAKKLVRDVGFYKFLTLSKKLENSKQLLVQGVFERFWDIMNTYDVPLDRANEAFLDLVLLDGTLGQTSTNTLKGMWLYIQRYKHGATSSPLYQFSIWIGLLC